jgi:hypothetical protein
MNYKPNYTFYYRDYQNKNKKYAIYSPAIDRFLFVTDLDMHMALETAEILSSKISNVLFVMPGTVTDVLTNDNCLNYTFENKTNIKVSDMSMSQSRHFPVLKYAYPENKIVEVGPSPAYTSPDRAAILANLKEYAEYVYAVCTSIDLTFKIAGNILGETEKFARKYLTNDWVKDVSYTVDSSNLEKGLAFEIRKMLYLESEVEVAHQKIIGLLKNSMVDNKWVVWCFFDQMGMPIPDELKDTQTQTPQLASSWIL